MTARVLKAPDVVLDGDERPASLAYREAVESAFAQGCAQGRHEATAGLEDQVAQLRNAVLLEANHLRDAAASAAHLDAAQVVALAADLASWVLEGVISADPAVLAASVVDAVREMSEESSVVLHVHPDVAVALGGAEGVGVNAVRADPDLGFADFRLVADAGMLERRFEESMKALVPELVACLGEARHDVST